MNKQRKVLITTTYNEMGIIIDTKVEEVTQTNLQPASTDTISRAKAIDLIESIETERLKGNIELIYAPAIKGLRALPPAQPKRGKWEMGKDERFVKCSECGLMTTRNELRGLAVFGKNEPNFCPNCGADMRGEQDG